MQHFKIKNKIPADINDNLLSPILLRSNSKYFYVIFGWIVLFIYLISSIVKFDPQTHFVSLAYAFLHGHLFITPKHELSEIISYHHHSYTIFPPMPAILLIPLIPFLGIASQQALSIFLATANILLSFTLFKRIIKKNSLALWISILYGFGTIQWYHAIVGSSWYTAHIAALFFLWLFLLEATGKQRLFIMGLLIGCGYLSRLPTIFAFVFVLVYFNSVFFNHHRLQIKSLLLFFLGLLPALLMNATYNYLRFGTILDVGYVLLPIQHEFWYRYGLINVKYIPIHLKELFTAMPIFMIKPPYVVPSLFSMAIWFTTPAFIYILRAPLKNRLTLASLAAVITIAILSLIHGGNGFKQFGYRFTLDYMPFLLILTALGFRNTISWPKIFLISLSIIINVWGVFMINFLNIWGYF